MERNSNFESTKTKLRKGELPAKKGFASAVSDADMAVMSKGYVPPNTQKNTDWAMNCFWEWRSARNKEIPVGDERRCPEDLLEKGDIEKLNHWISRLVAEVRNKKGECYPPRSIHQILAGLQSYMVDNNPTSPKFLNKAEMCFR